MKKHTGMVFGLIAALVLGSVDMTAFAKEAEVSGGDIGMETEVSGADAATAEGMENEKAAEAAEPVMYTYEDPQQRFTVTVTAEQGALPEGAELMASLLEEDSTAYAKAEAALKNYRENDETLTENLPSEFSETLPCEGIPAEDAEEGFVALDIHFELDGKEVEPASAVTVCIDAVGLLPENADPESLELQHHVEAEGTVEAVADSADETAGMIAVTENAGEATLDVVTTFEVDSFSTFTMTWNSGDQEIAHVTVHYVDAAGNELVFDGENHTLVKINAGKALVLALYHNGINHDGYTYSGSYVYFGEEKKPVTRIGYTTGNGGRWAYKDNDASNWIYVDRSILDDTIDLYMEFREIVGTVSENDIHENIKLTLYDYGSYIDYGEDKALQFGWHDRKMEAIDGLPLNQRAADGLHILYNSDISKSGLVYNTPTMRKTLNEEGFPQVADNASIARGKSLEYLFREDGPELYTGAAETPLTDYSKMREHATVYQVVQNGRTYNSYNSHFESMRFNLNGDAGLFYQDEEGYYVYDSSEMSAYFNQETGKFELSSCLIGPSHDGTDLQSLGLAYGMNFMPFDKIDYTKTDRFIPLPGSEDKLVYMTPFSETEDLRAEVSNMFFGMVMEIDFYMPKDGKIDGKDMVFEFSGDDDVWIYVDDVMVLDIGGTHGRLDGTINFATGQVNDVNRGGSYSTAIRTLKSTFEEAGVTGLFDGDTFGDYTKHTLKFYYLERGGNIGFCRLRFNIPTLPEKSLTVSKQLEAYENSEVTDMVKNALTYDFRVLRADADGRVTDEPFIREGDTYTILKNGVEAGTGTVGAGGRFGLKADEAAQFTDIWTRAVEEGVAGYVVEERLPNNVKGTYGAVEYVVGSSVNKITGESGVETEFTTYQTTALNVDETQFVNYKNKVKTTLPIEITKTEAGDEEPARQQMYQMKVFVGSIGDSEADMDPLAVGTEYTVGDTLKAVRTEGIIELAADETAVLKVLPGTIFKVEEVLNSDYTYYPSFAVDGVACGTEKAVGAIGLDQVTAAKVDVTNIYYVVPVYHKVTVNYWDKESGERLAESYVSEQFLEESAYDVTEQCGRTFEGYHFCELQGDTPTGILDTDKVVDVYYDRIYCRVTVNYVNKETGEKIAESYVSEAQRYGSSYDVQELTAKAIEGYLLDSVAGDTPVGTLDGAKIITVYYTEKPAVGSSEGSSSYEDNSSYEESGDVTMEEPAVPLEGLFLLEDERVPLAAAPGTGDEAPIEQMAAVLVAAGMGVVLLLKRKKEA